MKAHVTKAVLAMASTLIAGCETLSPKLQPENNFNLAPQSGLVNPVRGATASPGGVERLLWYRAQAIECSDPALLANSEILKCRGHFRAFIETAITASNDACDAWFDALGKSDVEVTYARNWMNIAGNSAQALMGLTGDSPTQIAKVALALGFANSNFDNYRSVYLMTSTLHKVRKTIESGRTTAATALRDNIAAYVSWDDVNEDVKGYHKSCSRDAIREILDAGVSATAYVLPGSDATQVKYDHANQQLYLLVFGSAGQFSESDLKELAGKHDPILAATPAVTAPPSAKAAHAKYQTLDDKGKSDFRRWLETIKAVQDARTKASTAAAKSAEKAEEDAAVATRQAVHAEISANMARAQAEADQRAAKTAANDAAKPALEALAAESATQSRMSTERAREFAHAAEIARTFARAQRAPTTAVRPLTPPRQAIRLEPLVDPARAPAMK
jgi:hypothetical protein